jgi:hypothetical protein
VRQRVAATTFATTRLETIMNTQTGLPGYEYELWWGIFAPAGTPPERVQ